MKIILKALCLIAASFSLVAKTCANNDIYTFETCTSYEFDLDFVNIGNKGNNVEL